jgi:hypothetical protein
MPIRLQEAQQLRAAYALSSSRFCVAIHEMQVDDPFSIVLEYNGAFSQPWTRTEMRRNIAGINAQSGPNGDDRPFIAISDEGDVYFLREEVALEKIPGAGLYSTDSLGRGPLRGIAIVRGQLHAFGEGGQLYRRADAWEPLLIADSTVARSGRLEMIREGGSGVAYAVGTLVPQFWETPADIEEAQLKAAQEGDLELFEKLAQKAEQMASDAGTGGVATGFMLRGDEDTWTKVDVATQAELRSVFVERSDLVWAVGTNGAILGGDPARRLEDRSFAGDREFDHVDVTSYGGQPLIASDYMLHRFDGHILSPFRPSLDPGINGGVPHPLAVEAFGSDLVYFDRKHGIHLFDGRSWREIEIPPSLLDRKFRASE